MMDGNLSALALIRTWAVTGGVLSAEPNLKTGVLRQPRGRTERQKGQFCKSNSWVDRWRDKRVDGWKDGWIGGEIDE